MEPDVKLTLDGDTAGSRVEILVWHQVMLNASPYFRSLLSPQRFSEGDKLARDGKVAILMPETNAQAMKVVCDIFHLRHEDIPVSDITSTMLFEISVLAAKFDCGKILQPWSRQWTEQDHIRQELEDIQADIGRATASQLSKWIKIFQALGYPTRSDPFVSALIKYHTVGDLMQQNDVCFDHLPSSLIDNMNETRMRAMTHFHAVALQFAELSERGDSCRLKLIQNEEGSPRDEWDDNVAESVADTRFHCSSITLGNFLLAARAELGSTWRSVDCWTETIAKTYHQMQQVAKHLTGPSHIALEVPRRYKKKGNIKTHENCALREDFSKQVEAVMQMLDDQISQGSATVIVTNNSNLEPGT